jgi:hypothetical protein
MPAPPFLTTTNVAGAADACAAKKSNKAYGRDRASINGKEQHRMAGPEWWEETRNLPFDYHGCKLPTRAEARA